MTENIHRPPICRKPRFDNLDTDTMLKEATLSIAASLHAAMATPRPSYLTSFGAADNRFAGLPAIVAVRRMLSPSYLNGAVGFGDYLEQLVDRLGEIWTGPKVSRIVAYHDDQVVGAMAAVLLGMLVTELVTNCCRYAYLDGGGGEIRVGFSVTEGWFDLVVADDGPYRSQSVVAQAGYAKPLIGDLTGKLAARLKYHSGSPGTIAMLSGPADALFLTEMTNRAS